MEYNFREIEKKWHEYWIANKFIKSKRIPTNQSITFWTCSLIRQEQDCT